MKKGIINTVGFQPGVDVAALRQLAKNTPSEFAARVTDLVEKGQITADKIRNWKGLFTALADVQVPVIVDVAGAKRAITASAFPVLTGSIVVKQINDRYIAIETIGQNLVQDIDDPKTVTTIAAVHDSDKNISEVKESEDFPEIGASEESVEIRRRRNGRLIRVSAEMIERNEVPNILARINGVAEIASDWIEEQTLSRITDYYGSKASPSEPYVYRPGGTGTAIFSATANTPGTRAPSGTCVQNNALADETDLENARVRLSTMKNNRGKRITIPYSERVLLVPDALAGRALKIANSEYVPGVENEVSNWGPMGKWRIPPERIYTSPKLDDLSATAWYYGAPQRQFVRKWALRMEYVTLGENTEAYLRARIAFQARVAWDVEIGATDYVYWVQNLAAATFPADA